MPLCAAEIDKVLYFFGMTDAGKFEAIGAISDLSEFLALFRMTYAELKQVLALPDEHLAAASKNIEALSFDKERQPSQEKILPDVPLPESLPQTSGLPDTAPDTTSPGTENGSAMLVTAATGVDSGETPITSSGDTPGPGDIFKPIEDIDPTELIRSLIFDSVQ